MVKRGAQLLILVLLASVNWQIAGRAAADDPQWYCENIFCPINQDHCAMQGGTMGCYWSEATNSCEVTPCMY